MRVPEVGPAPTLEVINPWAARARSASRTAVRLTVEDAARLGHWLTRCSTG